MTGILSSDILEEQFGPTEIEIVSQDDSKRVIRTKVIGSGQVLEESVVQFLPEGVAQFPQTHQTVMDGLSMGKAFRKDNIDFVRRVREVSRQPGKETVVSVLIMVGPNKTPYAEILETYSPEVNWPELT